MFKTGRFSVIVIMSIFAIFWICSIYRNKICSVKPLKCKTNNLTKIIHQSWKTGNLPSLFATLRQSWTEFCFKNWTYMFWTDKDNLRLIETKFSWFLPIYKQLKAPTLKADVARYFYMFEYGGIYTDMDNECLQPFEHMLQDFSLIFGAMKGTFRGAILREGYVQNSFMYSKPKQPFWILLLNRLIVNIRQNITTNELEDLTGPLLLTKFILSQRLIQIDHNLIVYPPRFFNPFSWISLENNGSCKVRNQMNATERKECSDFYRDRGAYVVQYHSHMWTPKG